MASKVIKIKNKAVKKFIILTPYLPGQFTQLSNQLFRKIKCKLLYRCLFHSLNISQDSDSVTRF